MNPVESLPVVADLMEEFVVVTGVLLPPDSTTRYLWTDAFGVCNFLELWRHTKDPRYLDLAQRLVDQVHQVLGRHRADDSRRGWISGLDEKTGSLHPTRGGLRIGKKLNERKQTESFDEQLEWERDGQYYHYLTRWMHTLCCMTKATRDPKFLRWALELAATAHRQFVYALTGGAGKRMYWKKSIDLLFPLVPSMGQHDPLDGLVTYYELQAAAAKAGEPAALGVEIADMLDLCMHGQWATDDPLGLGGLLTDAYRVAQLMCSGALDRPELLRNILVSSMRGLAAYASQYRADLPARFRLGFRELGLSIGLKAAGALRRLSENEPVIRSIAEPYLRQLEEHFILSAEIDEFWLEPRNRESESWNDHLSINTVMLATSLAPETYLSV